MVSVMHCPCGSPKNYVQCCGRYLDDNAIAPTADALMRSRYTAYTLGREDYLLATWHTSTRPVELNLAQLNLAKEVATKWLNLEVKQHTHDSANPQQATVEFIARYKVNGRACRLHEISHFVREDERWFYVEGEVS